MHARLTSRATPLPILRQLLGLFSKSYALHVPLLYFW